MLDNEEAAHIFSILEQPTPDSVDGKGGPDYEKALTGMSMESRDPCPLFFS
jgi:hypothetical protein